MAPSSTSGVVAATGRKMPPKKQTSDSIVGLSINKYYSIGTFLGEGAFGRVYAVHRTTGSSSNSNNNNSEKKNTEWAVKVVSNKAPTTTTSTTTKKKMNASTPSDRLHFEHLMYTQQLRPLCGTVIPNLPSNDNDKNTNQDYRCLIVERMQCELLHILPSFIKYQASFYYYNNNNMKTKKKEIALGPICTRLIRMVEAIHQTKHILLDVKPDNVMIDSNFVIPTTSTTTGTSTKTTTTMMTTEDLAKSIRLVDFGLLKPIGGTTGHHTENIPTSEVQGTPLYASVHVHNLHTPSRRDDIYAMLYVIGEIILHTHNILHGTGTKSTSCFPWSIGTSDTMIGKIKKEQMSSIQSKYFMSMPNPPNIANILYTAHQHLHDTKFAHVPNYNIICDLLHNIVIPIPESYYTIISSSTTGTTNTNVLKKRSNNDQVTAVASLNNTRLRRSGRSTSQEQDITATTTQRPTKFAKVAAVTKKNPNDDMDISSSNHSDDDDIIMYDAEQGDDDENDVTILNAVTAATHHYHPPTSTPPTITKNPYLVLKITSPPSMKDIKYVLEQGVTDFYTIGSGALPVGNKNKSGFLNFDATSHQIESKHASVRLVVPKCGTLMVEVHDMKSNTGTFISKKRIPSGKKQMAFCGHTIRIGNIEFLITSKMM